MSLMLSIIGTVVIIVVVRRLLQHFRKGKKRWDPTKDGWFGKSEILKDGRRSRAERQAMFGSPEWSRALFCDESRFSLQSDNRRVLIWRERDTRNNPAYIQETSHYREDGLMVWEGISIGGRTDLYVSRNGTLTAQRYHDDILRPVVLPYATSVGQNYPKDDLEIHPFTIKIDDEVLIDLKRRLENTRLEKPMDGTRFHYGFNSTYMKDFVQYWKDTYDWRAQEKLLNEYPQYTTQIEGLKIHFMRIKPVVDNDQVKVIPLMVLHGWPSTCFEFRKIIPLLTTIRPGEDFVFEVVCPSIPGYGFSEAPQQRGMTATAVARIFTKLMQRIGHPKFVVHGGDWGSRIATNMARFFPDRLYGLHFTMCSFRLRRIDMLKYIFFSLFPQFLKPEERFLVGIKEKLVSTLKESGYYFMNSTKPETLGCAMSDSPAGLAAYLLEKFSVATNRNYLNFVDGGLTKKYTMEELLNNVMITWINNSFTAAARFYVENAKDLLFMISERYPIHIPTGISAFPNEVILYPRFALSQQIKNIVSYNIMPRGGHFPALEEPELLANELWTFARTLKISEVEQQLPQKESKLKECLSKEN